MPNLKVIMALGLIAHNATLNALEKRKSQHKFTHGASFELTSDIKLISSYHCSRYNTNTRRLTNEMFFDVFREIREIIKS
jgi:uracil-DNA glycosylase